ncbi:MAG: hypothetical protein ACP5NW_04375 [Candidatus Woesearchaeota archaeon]
MKQISLKKLLRALLLLFSIMLVLSVGNVFAVPTGPSNIDPFGSSRYPVTPASNFSAIAGNVTELNFQSNSVTNTWQGYFGNISGSINLGDANNNTLYDWTSASPNGEIYATRSAVAPDWSLIQCASSAQVNQEDTDLNVNQSIDRDSVNRTFLNTTLFTTFYVGNVTIDSSQNCYAVNLHDSTGTPSSNFQEVILHDGSVAIYAAIISQDALGFDNRTHDFQMIVGEDGHNGDSSTTSYYFYVELG